MLHIIVTSDRSIVITQVCKKKKGNQAQVNGIEAVKKSKIIYKSKVEGFINKAIILSQIDNKNVLKLPGD